jgi:alpha-1,2-mannosyltransferase
MPMAHLAPGPAQMVFLSLNFLLALGSVLLILWAWPREGEARPGGVEAVAWSGLALFASPTVDTLASGQISLFQAVLVAGFAVLYLRGRGTLAALPLALSISLKITPAILLVYLLVRRDFRTVVASLGWVVALNLAAMLALGTFQPMLDFLTHFSRSAEVLLTPGNQSIFGLVARNLMPNDFWPNLWFAPNLVTPVSIAIGLALLGITVAAVRRPPAGVRGMALQMAPFVLLQLLFSVRSWPHYYVFVLVAMALAWSALRGWGPEMEKRLILALGISLGIAFLGGEISTVTWQLVLRYLVMQSGALCLATLALWTVLVAACLKMPRDSR